MGKKAPNPKPPHISKKPAPGPGPPRKRRALPLGSLVPACVDASDGNLDDGLYCKICGMGWYNCLCCHED